MLRVLLAQSLWQLCGSARVVVEEHSRQPLLTNLVIVTSVVKTENSNEGNSGLSPKPVMDTPDNPSDENTLRCSSSDHWSSRRNFCVHPGIQIVHSCPQGSDFSRQSVRQRDNGRLDRSTQLLQLSGREANTDLTR